jgi:DNA uptake protein ComE-like DNA-binding protein
MRRRMGAGMKRHLQQIQAMQARWKPVWLAAWFALAGMPGAAHPAAQASQKAPSAQGAREQATPAPEARVDINHATADELMKVPGMTATWAARIVRFRPYRTKQDLVDKGVVTSQVYDRIKDYVIAHRD